MLSFTPWCSWHDFFLSLCQGKRARGGEPSVSDPCHSKTLLQWGGIYSYSFQADFWLLFLDSLAQSSWSWGLGLTPKYGLCETTARSELLDCSLQWMITSLLYIFVCLLFRWVEVKLWLDKLLPGYESSHHQIYQTLVKKSFSAKQESPAGL